MPTTFTAQVKRPQNRYHIPVAATPYRRKSTCIHVDHFSEAWVQQALKTERSKHDTDPANSLRCRQATLELWEIAKPVLMDRFYTVFLDSAEFGYEHMHRACLQLLEPQHKAFMHLAALRMERHLLTDAYMSSAEEISTQEEAPDTPMDILLLGKAPSNRYLQHKKYTKDSLILAGKLIAETEALLLDLAEYAISLPTAGKTRESRADVSSGLPDLMPCKHWEIRDKQEGIIHEQRTAERLARADSLAITMTKRVSAARKLALSQSERILQQSFAPKKTGRRLSDTPDS